MRDLFKTVMTGSFLAGAALLVAACGGGESTEANNTAGNYAGDEALMGNDVTAVDALNGTDANLGTGMDANMGATTDMNTTGGTTGGNMTGDAGMNATAGGNTTGM